MKVKFRESFRPFAPAILEEDVSDWFETNHQSPYMLFVSNVKNDKIILDKNSVKEEGFEKLKKPLSKVPAITHVDYSARIQTISQKSNKIFYSLLKSFKEKTGCPILINTSFNVRGEPIVLSPDDAYKCFMGTELDILVCGEYILYKNDQNSDAFNDYKDLYELD